MWESHRLYTAFTTFHVQCMYATATDLPSEFTSRVPSESTSRVSSFYMCKDDIALCFGYSMLPLEVSETAPKEKQGVNVNSGRAISSISYPSFFSLALQYCLFISAGYPFCHFFRRPAGHFSGVLSPLRRHCPSGLKSWKNVAKRNIAACVFLPQLIGQ